MAKVFVRYEKMSGSKKEVLEGLLNPDGTLLPWVELNQFARKSVEIPSDFKRVKLDENWVKEFKYDPKKKLLEKKNKQYTKIKEKHTKYRRFLTHNNGSRPYLVYVGKKDISVYTLSPKHYVPEKYLDSQDLKHAWMYIEPVLVGRKFIKVWVGESLRTPMTIYAGTDSKDFLGNSILCQLKASRFLFVGHVVYTFDVDDEMLEYHSPVGNNDVPYPVAIGEKYFYFLAESGEVLPVNEFGPLTDELKKSAYDHFYEHDLSKKASEPVNQRWLHPKTR